MNKRNFFSSKAAFAIVVAAALLCLPKASAKSHPKTHSAPPVASETGTESDDPELRAIVARDMEALSGAATVESLRPGMVSIRDSSGFLIGGMSELFKGSGIYITSHHVIEGVSKSDWNASLAASGIDSQKQICYEFYHQGSGFPGDPTGLYPLDVIMSVPKNDTNLILQPAPEIQGLDCSGVENQELIPYQLRPAPTHSQGYSHTASPGDKFTSFQYGSLGTKETSTVSSGFVFANTFDGKFFLPPFNPLDQTQGTNRTTLRGSGSLVFLKSPEDTDWKVGGVIECQVPSRAGTGKKSSLNVPGGTRVIPISLLFSFSTKVFRVSCSSAKTTEPRVHDKDCVPVDGRGGGSF